MPDQPQRGAAAATSAGPQVSGAAESRREVRAPDIVPWLIALGVFAAYTTISVYRYLRLDPASWDLGIFTEYVKQYALLRAPIVDIKRSGFDLLGDHFTPIVALLAPFFRLYPSPVTLLVAQALLAAVSVLPVYRAAAERLGVGPGRAIAAAYGFCWGLQQLVYYDFHELAFAVPLLACSLSALVRERIRGAVLWALPLVLVKEDQGFTVAAIGLIIAFGYRRRMAGLALAAWGLAWSLLAILVIIPHFNPRHSYAYWLQGGAASPVGGHFDVTAVAAQLAAGGSTKLATLGFLVLPTALAALRSPLVLAALPDLALRFVSPNSVYWGTAWHYNAPLMPIVFVAAIDGLARLRAARTRAARRPARLAASAGRRAAALRWLAAIRSRVSAVPGRAGTMLRWLAGLPRRVLAAPEWPAAIAMLAICAALAFRFPLSGLWNSQTYQITQHVRAADAAMSRVPNGVTVATDLDLLATLAARDDTFWLGNYPTNPATRYVVFDTHSTDFQPPPRNVLKFVEQLVHGARYRQVYVRNGVYVFRRR
jgi:uncharacterized membrane protein